MPYFLDTGQFVPGVSPRRVSSSAPWMNAVRDSGQGLANMHNYVPGISPDRRPLNERIIDAALSDMTADRDVRPAGTGQPVPPVVGGMRPMRPSARMAGLAPQVLGRDKPPMPGMAEIDAEEGPRDAGRRGLGDMDFSPDLVEAGQALAEADNNPGLVQRMIAELATGGQDKEEAKWMAVARAGLGMMASRNPTALGAIGEGGIGGLSDYQDYQRNASKNKALAAQLQQTSDRDTETKRSNKATESYKDKDIEYRNTARMDNLEARREELEYRYEALKSASEDRDLSREDRAIAQREANATRVEIARLTVAAANQRNDASNASRESIAAAKRAAAASAGANKGHEINWINYAVEQGMVEDSVDGRKAALAMIKRDTTTDIKKKKADIAKDLYNAMVGDFRDRRSLEEKQADANAKAAYFLGEGEAPATAAPPAAPEKKPDPGKKPETKQDGAMKFNSAEDVRSAYTSGKITKDKAREILTNQFPDALKAAPK